MSTKGSKSKIPDEEIREPGNLTLILLGVVALFLTLFSIYSIYLSLSRDYVKPPAVIVSFLDEVIASNTDKTDFVTVLNKYLDTGVSSGFGWSATPSHNWVAFKRTIFNHGDIPVSYEIAASYEGLIELVLYDVQGDALYPRLTLAYKLSDDGQTIVDFTFARMQPFSILDSEYKEDWG